MAESKKILFLSNHFITLFFFRRELIGRLVEAGHEVYLSMPADKQNSYFENMGCHIIETPMSRRGMNPTEDFGLMLNYRRIMKDVDPDIIFSYTVKPNVYGTMASNALGYKQVCNVTGTGNTFLKETVLSKLVRMLYRVSMKKAYKVFFQNSGDRDYFIEHGLVKDNYDMLPGSGVNLEQHSFCEMPDESCINFIYVGRIMAVKGIEQYLECAKNIREKYSNTKFYIAGFIEEDRYEQILKEAGEAGIVDYIGFRKDIDDWVRKCHCTVLPSLGGEGVPNVLLETAATGRACIASDINGSREVIEEGKTGYLFTPGDAQDLIKKAEEFLNLTAEERRAMGRAGRERVERLFDREIVIKKYFQEVEG